MIFHLLLIYGMFIFNRKSIKICNISWCCLRLLFHVTEIDEAINFMQFPFSLFLLVLFGIEWDRIFITFLLLSCKEKSKALNIFSFWATFYKARYLQIYKYVYSSENVSNWILMIMIIYWWSLGKEKVSKDFHKALVKITLVFR